jgi:hypothetical protein
MASFMDSINSTKHYITNMILFNQLKTGDPIVDTFLTTLILGFLSWFINWLHKNEINASLLNSSFDDIKSIFLKKNIIIIEGYKSSCVSSYSQTQCVSSVYSDRFKALLGYIIKNIENNTSINIIKESHTNCQTTLNLFERYKSTDLFMVYQNKYFLLDNNIYAKIRTESEMKKDDTEKLSVKTDKITLHIYSYTHSITELIRYIDAITEKYVLSIKDSRFNKRFVYSIHAPAFHKKDALACDYWRENIFESSRTFNNIFFDNKKQLIDKIDFFLNNKNWYYEKGIPYSIGIGLHGPPGTGKTSFIKALATYTNRHIIQISLKEIKTKAQLEQLFFEDTYNNNNQFHSISWDKKIIVFEDIDCIGDIVLSREEKNKKIKKINEKKEDLPINTIIQTICELTETTQNVSPTKDPPITLDDILNLWDGIRETPGRILIISSNHYNKLDPALVRPGRIDITHELSNASHQTISDLYLHLFGKKIDTKQLSKIKQHFYSPAELINIYVSNKNEVDFMNRLLTNTKI